MALATTCPQCKTSFKVVPDQLKLRRGLVRCGVCQHVFSGIDYLRYVDDAARAAQRAARERAASQDRPDGEAAASGAQGVSGPSGDASQGSSTSPAAPGSSAESTFSAAATPPATSTPSTSSTASPEPTSSAAQAAPPGPSARSHSPTTAADADPRRSDEHRAHDAPAAGTTPLSDASTASPPGDLPADPWAAAAAIAHERSLRDDGAAAAAPGYGDLEPPREDTPVTPGERALRASTAPDEVTSAPAFGDAALMPSGPASGAPVPPWSAPAASAAAHAPSGIAPPASARPALPAPDASRVPLDDLLARPAAPWPPAAGPQTIIGADDDLKTAFFLTDSSFGPLPGETSDVMPPTSIHRPGAHAEPVTRVHGEAPPAPSGASADASASPASTTPPDTPRGTPPALPGLPLRPERGTPDETIDAAPAFVPVPPPPFEPAPRRADPPPPEPAIDYFPDPRRRSRSLGLALSPAAWAAAIGLSVLLALQAVVGWRDAIAARVPLVAPTLAGLLGPFGLEVRPPRELDAMTIEGFELQASGTPNVLTLSAVLRNRSAHVVGYPAMELTLTDSAGALIVRKVIPPELYVGDPSTIDAGLAARSERPLRLALQHDGLQPTGFAVALFYP